MLIRTRWSKIILREINFVREARKQLGYTQVELAQAAGVGVSTISNIEKGVNRPSVYIAIRICRVLDAPVEEIFTVK